MSQAMRKDRATPERSPAALKNQTQQFLDTHIEKLVREAREADTHPGGVGRARMKKRRKGRK